MTKFQSQKSWECRESIPSRILLGEKQDVYPGGSPGFISWLPRIFSREFVLDVAVRFIDKLDVRNSLFQTLYRVVLTLKF